MIVLLPQNLEIAVEKLHLITEGLVGGLFHVTSKPAVFGAGPFQMSLPAESLSVPPSQGLKAAASVMCQVCLDMDISGATQLTGGSDAFREVKRKTPAINTNKPES